MATYAFKTRQYGPSATGSILTYQDLDYSLLFLSASILQKTGSMKVLGSMESSGQLTVGSSAQIGTSLSVSGITNLIDLNAGTTVLTGTDQSIPLTVYDDTLGTNAFVVNTTNYTIELGNAGATHITKVNDKLEVVSTATVTGSIINTAIVSASIAISGNTGARSFTVSLTKNNGTALTNQRQVIHWWTSGTQYGAAEVIALNGYTVVSGSNISSVNSGSINHAVTDASGKFAVKLTNTSQNPPNNPVYFHVEVQGAVCVVNSTVDTGTNPA